ncbi:MAG: PaaI family thioesterase [Myxococcota bacterium]
MGSGDAETIFRQWATDDPQRVVGRGHPVGDYLDAHDWRVVLREPGRLRVQARLPERVMNPRGELFGGFTPTYADFFGLHVFHTTRAPDAPRRWLATADLRVDYFAPIHGPDIEIEGRVLHRRARTAHVQVEFFDDAANLCALSKLTLIERAD